MTQEYYTGVHGVVTYAGAALAVSEFEFEITRGEATHARSGKWSDLSVPGKVSCKGKLGRIQKNADLIMAMMNATPVTGTATTLLATSTVLDASDFYEDMTDSTPGSASIIRATLQTSDLSVAGTITYVGTDAAGNTLSETIDIPATMTTGEYYDTDNVFLTVEGMTVREIDSSDDIGTFAIASIAGDTSVTIGEPKSFALIGAVEDGSNHITVTLANVTFSKAKLGFTDASSVLSDDAEFFVKDPDDDIIVTGADT
ncbi:hypothetical protein D4R86_05700 [bacterium]|nr:MAG: hypothetical protein D4R86_05700 [bacterium]